MKELTRIFRQTTREEYRSMLNKKDIECNIDWLLNNGSVPVKYLTHVHLLEASSLQRNERAIARALTYGPLRYAVDVSPNGEYTG